MDGSDIGTEMIMDSVEALQAENERLKSGSIDHQCDQRLKGRIAQLETELAASQREVDRLRHQALYRSDSVDEEIKAWRGEVDELVTAIRIIARRLK